MEKAYQKFFKKLIMNKYPMFLDVYIRPYIEGSLRYDNPSNKERYEVFLVIHEKDYRGDKFDEVMDYVRDIGAYMNVEVMGVYGEVVDDEAWEDIKNN